MTEPLAGFLPVPGTGGFPTVDQQGIPEPPLHKITKIANETVNNSSTLQDDDELKFIVKPYEVYMVTTQLTVNSGTTPDLKHAWSVPAGTLGFHSTTGTNSVLTTAIVTQTSGSDEVVNAYAIMFVGAPGGTVVLQWAQSSAQVADTKVLAGSFLIIRKVT